MTLKKILTGGYKAFACRISGLYPSFWRQHDGIPLLQWPFLDERVRLVNDDDFL